MPPEPAVCRPPHPKSRMRARLGKLQDVFALGSRAIRGLHGFWLWWLVKLRQRVLAAMRMLVPVLVSVRSSGFWLLPRRVLRRMLRWRDTAILSPSPAALRERPMKRQVLTLLCAASILWVVAVPALYLVTLDD